MSNSEIVLRALAVALLVGGVIAMWARVTRIQRRNNAWRSRSAWNDYARIGSQGYFNRAVSGR